MITQRPGKAEQTPLRSPKLAIVLGALAGVALSVVAHPANAAQTIVALAAACGFLAALLLGARASRGDWYAVQLMLALNLGVFAVTQSGALDVPIRAAAGASALGLAAVATLQRFRK